MAGRVRRGEKMLDRLVNAKRLTPEGKACVIACVDPFHDKPIENLRGWPDMNSGASVVQCVKVEQQISFTSAGGPAAGANWDCHMWLAPWFAAHDFLDSDVRQNNICKYDAATGGGGSTDIVSGLTIMKKEVSGGDCEYFPATGSQTTLGCLRPDDEFVSRNNRILGVGFEVYDTTAELYKQGSVTTWSHNQNPKDGCSFHCFNISSGFSANDFPSYDVTGTMFRHPPVNAAQAKLLPGTVTRNASEGTYQVAKFHTTDNPAFATDYNVPIVHSAPTEGDLPVSNANPVNLTGLYIAAPISYGSMDVTTPGNSLKRRVYQAPGTHIYPFHGCGAIFQGLHPSASLKVCLNVFIEVFPDWDDKILLPLATPSCSYDPVAIELIQHLMSNMPVSVPVKDNGLGEWFAEAVSFAADFVAPALIASGNPYAVAAGGALELASPLAKGYVKKQKKKKKKAKAQAQLPPHPDRMRRGQKLPPPPPVAFAPGPGLKKKK